jgi:long-chain acyl-CoA synthetase
MLKTDNLGMMFDADQGGDNVALIDCRDWDAPRSYTHRQLHEAANACARGLLARGLSRGDRVAILSANRVEFLIAFFGTMRAGLVSVPVNHKFADATIDFILSDSNVKLALCDEERTASLPKDFPVCSFDDSGPAGCLHPCPD